MEKRGKSSINPGDILEHGKSEKYGSFKELLDELPGLELAVIKELETLYHKLKELYAESGEEFMELDVFRDLVEEAKANVESGSTDTDSAGNKTRHKIKKR